VVALMLAQRFPEAFIDAVEIDPVAAKTAEQNFGNSTFADRLKCYGIDFQEFFVANPDKRYDLIVSNPPFYVHSLKSPSAGKVIAKHTDVVFFKALLSSVNVHLEDSGSCWLILPVDPSDNVAQMAAEVSLFQRQSIAICSFEDSQPHRLLTCIGRKNTSMNRSKFVIYKDRNVYSNEYSKALEPFFTIF